jgi:transposase
VTYDRFSRGTGLWAKILTKLQAEEGIAFNEVTIDGATMKVHRRGGGQKGGLRTKGRSRAGTSVRFRAAATGDGKLVERLLSDGRIHDVSAAAELAEDITGRAVMAGCGYGSDGFRRELEENDNTAVTPARGSRRKEIAYDRERYKKRGLMERIFGKLKENRLPTVRYEKSDANFLGFILIAFLKILLFLFIPLLIQLLVMLPAPSCSF